ncbi:MAG: hypothetical protein ACRCWY_09205 [Cellulosilyticaceae bacterium]
MAGKVDKKVQARLEKILKGGSSLEKNVFVGILLICTMVFCIITVVVSNEPTYDERAFTLGLCIGGSIFCVILIAYLQGQHSKYRKVLKERYEALTAKELEEIAYDMRSYKENNKHLVIGDRQVYGRFAMVGKVWTQSFNWIKYEDMVWAYELRDTFGWSFHRNNPNLRNSLIIMDKWGRGYVIDCEKQHYDKELRELQSRSKCVVGYDKEKKQVYKMDPQAFRQKY